MENTNDISIIEYIYQLNVSKLIKIINKRIRN